MEKYVLGTVIAERELSLPGGKTFTVRIGMPQAHDADECFFFCPYEIVSLRHEIAGLRNPTVRRSGGIDSAQAIQSAFVLIGIELHELNRFYRNTLRWEGGEAGDFGFPLPQNILDILEGPAAGQETAKTSIKKRGPKQPSKRTPKQKK